MPPNCKIRCILENFAKKSTQLAQIGCFSAGNGIMKGLIIVLSFTIQSSNPYFVSLFIGDDLKSLLFHFLDELLFLFSADPFFIARVSTKE